jgi:endonuclease III
MDDGRARLIKAVLGDLFLKKNQLSLDFLKKYQEKQAYDVLKRIEGLPDAVIDEVMLISLHHTCFPMNASVTRVCDRLGIVGGGDGGSARDFMAAIVPKTLMPMGYMLFNAHGERTCKPKTPDCGVCALTACCTYFGEKSGPKRPAAGAKGAKPGRKGKTRPSPTKKKTGKAPSS